MKTEAYIGNLTVRSNQKLIVYGSVRGLVSEHRKEARAERSLQRDRRGCRIQGGYSDACIYRSQDGRWFRDEIIEKSREHDI